MENSSFSRFYWYYHFVHIYTHSFDLIGFFFLLCYCFWFHADTPIKSIPYFKNKRSISIIFSWGKLPTYASHRYSRCYSLEIRFYCICSSLSLGFSRIHFLLRMSSIFQLQLKVFTIAQDMRINPIRQN
jgi:hypothetical protein